MAYYVALNTAAVRIGEGRAVELEVVTLEHDEAGLVLPVFTTGELFDSRCFSVGPQVKRAASSRSRSTRSVWRRWPRGWRRKARSRPWSSIPRAPFPSGGA